MIETHTLYFKYNNGETIVECVCEVPYRHDGYMGVDLVLDKLGIRTNCVAMAERVYDLTARVMIKDRREVYMRRLTYREVADFIVKPVYDIDEVYNISQRLWCNK